MSKSIIKKYCIILWTLVYRSMYKSIIQHLLSNTMNDLLYMSKLKNEYLILNYLLIIYYEKNESTFHRNLFKIIR